MNLRRPALRSLGLLRGWELKSSKTRTPKRRGNKSHCWNKIGSNLFSVGQGCRTDQDIQLSSLYDHTYDHNDHTLRPHIAATSDGHHQKSGSIAVAAELLRVVRPMVAVICTSDAAANVQDGFR
jgi:hypothetical protein